MKKPDRIPINTRYMLGFEIKMPVSKEALALTPHEQDYWAREQIKQAGYRPQTFCHMRKVYEGNTEPVAIMVSTYTYRKEAREDKAEFHPA